LSEEFDPVDAPRDTPPTKFDHIIYESLDPEKSSEPEIRGDEAGPAEAAAELRQTPGERNEITERVWGDPRDWSKHAPGNRSVSAEHASDMLAEAREAEAALAQAELDAATARAVDDFRAEPPELGQAQPQQPELAPQAEVPPAEPTELDRMLAELPEHRRAPFVNAFNEMVTRAQHQASTEYQQALQQVQGAVQQLAQTTQQTIQVGEAIARQPFPELHNVSDADLPAVLRQMAQVQPQRYAQVVAHAAQVKQLVGQQLHQQQVFAHAQQQQQQQQQQQVEAQQRQFRQYAELHDSRTLVNESPETRKAIESALIEGAEREGIDKQTLVQIWNNNPVARHSYFQNLIADGVKYRLAQRAVAFAAVRPVPQVQRPGAANEESRDYSEYAHLERQYRGQQSLTPKQAAELVIAKRARR
jgi:hypothetical protein